MRLSKVFWTGLFAGALVAWAAGSTSGKTLYVDDKAPNFGGINGDCRGDWKDLGIMGLHWLERAGA